MKDQRYVAHVRKLHDEVVELILKGSKNTETKRAIEEKTNALRCLKLKTSDNLEAIGV